MRYLGRVDLNCHVGHSMNAFGGDCSCCCTGNELAINLGTLLGTVQSGVRDGNGINVLRPVVLDGNVHGRLRHLGGHDGILLVDAHFLVLDIGNLDGRLIEAVGSFRLADGDAGEREEVPDVLFSVGRIARLAFRNIQIVGSDIEVDGNIGVSVLALGSVCLVGTIGDERSTILGGHVAGANSRNGTVMYREHLGTPSVKKLGNIELNLVHFHRRDGNDAFLVGRALVPDGFNQHGAHHVDAVFNFFWGWIRWCCGG